MRLVVSPGVKQFSEKAQNVWGLKLWEGPSDPDKDLLFFGLYFQEDYDTFKNAVGNKTIFWCGSDILAMMKSPERWMAVRGENIKHYCETEVEAANLIKMSIMPEIVPSFLGNIKDYPISFQPPTNGENWKLWLCGHPGRESEYGFNEAKEIPNIFDNVEVHLYGVDGKNTDKIFYHGLVSEEQLDKDIKKYHCALRGNFHDGVSEVVLKSLFLGQYPIARLPYEGVWQYKNFGELIENITKLQTMVQPNYEARSIWLKKINNFYWCKKTFYVPEEK